MSTPIEIVRAQSNWWNQGLPGSPPHTQDELYAALASVLADAERFKALERAHNHPGSPHYWWEPGVSVFTPLAELADRLREGQNE